MVRSSFRSTPLLDAVQPETHYFASVSDDHNGSDASSNNHPTEELVGNLT
jgi:hypothetical protein